MSDLSEQLERKQKEIDEARDLLRGLGLRNFGTLLEGMRILIGDIEQAIQRLPKPMPTAMAISMTDAAVQDVAARIRAVAARLGGDQNYRLRVSFRLEVLGLCLQMYQEATETDAETIVVTAERELKRALEPLVKLENSKS
jgi:hypothetical protein